MSPKIDGKNFPLWESIEVKANQTLEMAFATIGARSYIAFQVVLIVNHGLVQDQHFIKQVWVELMVKLFKIIKFTIREK